MNPTFACRGNGDISGASSRNRVDFRLTVTRDSKAVKAFLDQARRNCGLYPPATIVTDKAPTYPALIKAKGEHAYYHEPVKHIDQKGGNNRIESDQAALKRIVNPGKGFRSLRTAKATLLGIDAIRTIKRGDLVDPASNAQAEIRLVSQLFGIAV